MDKETWKKEFLEFIDQKDTEKYRPHFKKIDYGGTYETLKRISPNILNKIKKTYL